MRDFKALLALTISGLAAPAFAQYAPEQPPASAGYDRYEQYLWDGAVRKNTPDGYQTYLQRYPQGRYADQARYQLDGFARGAPAYPQPQAAPAYPASPPAQQQQQQAYPPQQYQQPAPAPTYAQPEPQPQPEPQAAPSPIEPALPPAPEPAPPPAAAVGAAAPVAAPAVAPPLPGATTPAPTVATAPASAPVKGSPLFLCRPVFASGTPPFEQAGEAEIAAYLQALKVNSVAAYEAYLKAFPHGIFAPAVDELVATRGGRAKALAALSVPGPSQAHPRSPVTITPADYPQGASGAGSATAIWEVAEDGCVQYCRIEKSSGNAALDAATCRILSTRGSYEPARDSAGKPIRSIETGTFGWTAAK